jgi:hypothetical protein
MEKDYHLLPVIALYVTIAVGIVIAGATIVGGIAFWRAEKGTAKTFSLLIQRANFLQMLAVVLIILAAVGLRLADKIGAEAVVSLLSGVAGFVLGGVTKSKQGDEEKSPTS